MRDDLVQPNQGHSQPRHLPIIGLPAWLIGAVAIGILALGVMVVRTVVAPGGRTQSPAPVASPVVLLSGRDDHGLLVDPFVALAGAPGEPASVGRIRDGSFVKVLEQRGSWMYVREIAPPHAEGWIDDYYLRDRALRDDGQGQVLFVDAGWIDGQVMVAVQPIERPHDPPAWVAAALLHEVGAQGPQHPFLQP